MKNVISVKAYLPQYLILLVFSALFAGFMLVKSGGCGVSVRMVDAAIAETIGNENVAPADIAELLPMNIEKFIKQYSKVAIAEMDKTKIPASIAMAQAIIESRAGTSILATKNNNMFGIKCALKPGVNKECGKTHCTNHCDDSCKDFFLKYNNEWESWQEHSQFLMRDRYAPLFKLGKDYKLWAAGLQKYGYATDEAYSSKLVKAVEKYKLYDLDKL